MPGTDTLRIARVDHVEFAVGDLERAAEVYWKMGFTKSGTRELRERQIRSLRLVSGDIHILLTHSSLATDPVAQYVKRHGDGVFSLGLLCDDAVSALETATSRGARVAEAPRSFQRDEGTVSLASVFAFGDVRHSFVSRQGAHFFEGFDGSWKSPSGSGYGLSHIDHVVCCTEPAKRAQWKAFYENVFHWTGTEESVRNPEGTITLVASEPSAAASSAHEFFEVHHGSGIQSIALAANDLPWTLARVRREGLPVEPETEGGRVPHVAGAFSYEFVARPLQSQ